MSARVVSGLRARNGIFSFIACFQRWHSEHHLHGFRTLLWVAKKPYGYTHFKYFPATNANLNSPFGTTQGGKGFKPRPGNQSESQKPGIAGKK
jgi:hypothetical protein